MKEISRDKRLEVAQYYLLGHTYKEIEEETGIAHGSIANIVNEVENGVLTIPGIAFDQVNDLRQLFLDLKKKALEPSQALLGVTFFERLKELGISPENLKKWSELVKSFAPAGFPVKNFFEAALRLHELEKSEAKPFENLTEEYISLEEKIHKLRTEKDSLIQEGRKLTEEINSLRSEGLSLKKNNQKLQEDKVSLILELEDLQSQTERTKEEGIRLNKELEESRKKLVKLSSEVEGREAFLIRLNDIGFLDEDLLRLRAIVERIAEDTGASENEVKERFFAGLGNFKDITELQKCQAAEMEMLKNLAKEKSLLTGEIASLENQRDILSGDIKASAASALQQITDAGQDAVAQLQKQAESMRRQIDTLFVHVAEAAETVGEMNALVKKGEDSGKNLNSFIEELTGKAGKN